MKRVGQLGGIGTSSASWWIGLEDHEEAFAKRGAVCGFVADRLEQISTGGDDWLAGSAPARPRQAGHRWD
jgi:hypothetical protein